MLASRIKDALQRAVESEGYAEEKTAEIQKLNDTARDLRAEAAELQRLLDTYDKQPHAP